MVDSAHFPRHSSFSPQKVLLFPILIPSFIHSFNLLPSSFAHHPSILPFIHILFPFFLLQIRAAHPSAL
jgi:hypothetical protein